RVAVLLWLLGAVPARAAAGDLDPGFGTGGKVTTDLGGNSAEAEAVAVQANGKIVAGGRSFTSSALDDWAVARYRPDGTLDPRFGTGGKVTIRIGGAGAARGVAVLARGALGKAGGEASSRGHD